MRRRRLLEGGVLAAAVVGAVVVMAVEGDLGAALTLLAVSAVLAALLELDGRHRHALRSQLESMQQQVARVRADQRAARDEIRRLRRRLEKQLRTEPGRTLTRTIESSVGQISTELAQTHQLVEEHADRARARQIELRRSLRDLKHEPLTQQQSMALLQSWFTPDAPLPAVGGWAMEPTTLVEIVDLITRLRPTTVVECGSGTSTMWVTQALRRNGHGRVVSLDHDGDYAAATRAHLARHGLGAWAEVRHAPLVPTETDHGPLDWYNVDAASLPLIDMLVVDGPPKATGDLARYPALPVLVERLAPDAVIVLDDADRAGERRIVELWQEQHGVRWTQKLVGRALLLGLGDTPPAAR
ncbi:class I SAM-dependent methyltransferase [Ruania alba]|uniref:Methyltransferase domain-containing protein n=1 Tax=Ruania alba TaxID=648782 RepID=A0A1H5NBP8_9MICO|nr:class I SAM-dependent methyltransferase [Ruania alba]SEE98291.1 Methyltransferase domain-containing protein [Ruania alba]